MIENPTAEPVLAAIVAACREVNASPDRIMDETPAFVAGGAPGSRARQYALAALVETFPKARPMLMARCVGFTTRLNRRRSDQVKVSKCSWWSRAALDRVKAAIDGRAAHPLFAHGPIEQVDPPSFFEEKPEVAPRTVSTVSRSQDSADLLAMRETVTLEEFERISAPVIERIRSPVLRDTRPLPQPRKAVRRSVDVTGELMGDPGYKTLREANNDRSSGNGA